MENNTHIIITRIEIDRFFYEFFIESNDLETIFHNKSFSSNYPGMVIPDQLKMYLRDLIVEEYIYEEKVSQKLNNNDGIIINYYTSNPRGIFNSHANNPKKGHSVKEWYMNSGLMSNFDEDIYLKFIPVQENITSISIKVSFKKRPCGIELKCISSLFNDLLVKKSINLKGIVSLEDHIGELFYNHIIKDDKRDDGSPKARWTRLGIKYKPQDERGKPQKDKNGKYVEYSLEKIKEESLQNELFSQFKADVRYSLHLFQKRPWLAIPTTLNDESLNDKDYLSEVISQFVIPFYYSEKPDRPQAAIVISCRYPKENLFSDYKVMLQNFEDEIIGGKDLLRNDEQQEKNGDNNHSRSDTERHLLCPHYRQIGDNNHSKSDKDYLRNIIHQLGDQSTLNYLLYCSVTYEMPTILTLNMVQNDTLLALNGYNGNDYCNNMWFKTYLRDLPPGKEDCRGQVIYSSVRKKYYIRPQGPYRLIEINDIEKWRGKSQRKLWNGECVRFSIDYDRKLSEIYPCFPNKNNLHKP